MFAGAAKQEITPTASVWMEGMLRTHKSEGIHDSLHARALVLSTGTDPASAAVIAVADLCVLHKPKTDEIRRRASERTGIPAERMVVAVSHTHSGPSTSGLLCPLEEEYTERVIETMATVITEAWHGMQPAVISVASGKEGTISNYRRLLADDGHVVMNWEPFPPEHIIGPIGVIDPELGVLRVTAAGDPDRVLAILFNHAGHPNVLSGENYLISADYPGLAERRLESAHETVAIFANGAQGTMDIDGLRDRDWEGLERVGNALADAVEQTLESLPPAADDRIYCGSVTYSLPPRQITDEEYAWAQEIIKETGGEIAPLADGVGDDYVANLYLKLREVQNNEIPCEQVCIATGDAAWISVPAELYTEIGLKIKAQSPFRYTYIVGLANGYVSYIPTPVAIYEGGYAEVTRIVDASAEACILQHSQTLLEQVFTISHTKGVHS